MSVKEPSYYRPRLPLWVVAAWLAFTLLGVLVIGCQDYYRWTIGD